MPIQSIDLPDESRHFVSARFNCTDFDDRKRGIEIAAESIRAGKLVLSPTDTVYGIAADAFNSAAVTNLQILKKRVPETPVSVLVSSTQMLAGLTDQISDLANELITAFWPGPLSVVFRHHSSLQWYIGSTRGTVTVRMPRYPLLLELISKTGPIAVSSATSSRSVNIATIDQAIEEYGEGIDVYLDGGELYAASPLSTVVDATRLKPEILRSGAIPDDDILRTIAAG
jgi:L-threonylcarbamoyladenylate synthase